jgi:hypothetical protein
LLLIGHAMLASEARSFYGLRHLPSILVFFTGTPMTDLNLEPTMHTLLAEEIVKVCRARSAEGDCPITPSESIERLEQCVIELAHQLQVFSDLGHAGRSSLNGGDEK